MTFVRQSARSFSGLPGSCFCLWWLPVFLDPALVGNGQ